MNLFRISPQRALWLVLAAACASTVPAHAAPPGDVQTLYQRLGGPDGVTRWVDHLIDRCAADPRTRRSFDGIKLSVLKESLVQQICAISAGGCRYEGETMERAHRDARIGAGEFDALVSVLREELDRAGVEAAAKNELLRLLAPMKRDIVSGGDGAGAIAKAPR